MNVLKVYKQNKIHPGIYTKLIPIDDSFAHIFLFKNVFGQFYYYCGDKEEQLILCS